VLVPEIEAASFAPRMVMAIVYVVPSRLVTTKLSVAAAPAGRN
jgi:hypothetical protein